jgi:hypothetical protein
MADYQYSYKNKAERQNQIEIAESLGLRMIHDNFDIDWKRGEEPRGTMVFTDDPGVNISPPRDLLAEIDDLKARIQALEVA